MAQRDRLDRACLKFERAGSGRAQNSNLLNGPGRAGLKAGTGRAGPKNSGPSTALVCYPKFAHIHGGLVRQTDSALSRLQSKQRAVN